MSPGSRKKRKGLGGMGKLPFVEVSRDGEGYQIPDKYRLLFKTSKVPRTKEEITRAKRDYFQKDVTNFTKNAFKIMKTISKDLNYVQRKIDLSLIKEEHGVGIEEILKYSGDKLSVLGKKLKQLTEDSIDLRFETHEGMRVKSFRNIAEKIEAVKAQREKIMEEYRDDLRDLD